MKPGEASLTRFALNTLYYSGLYRCFEPAWSGLGAIFTLHHVVPQSRLTVSGFAPNRILEISAEFLEQTILQVRNLDIDIVALDEARRRLVEKDHRRRFVCFTLDDGYKDNFETAFPVFRKHNAPFAVYVTTGIVDRTAILWWVHLEQIVQQSRAIDLTFSGQRFARPTATPVQKYRAFNAIYWFIRGLSQQEQQAVIADLLAKFGMDSAALCSDVSMSWDMLAELAGSELVTIGAHTVNHFALSKLAKEDVFDEVVSGGRIIAEKLGRQPRHFCYPYGDDSSAGSREFAILNELGYHTSATTRKGLVFPQHVDHLQALPRVSLNGDYQESRFVRLFLGGAPFALWKRFHRLDVY